MKVNQELILKGSQNPLQGYDALKMLVRGQYYKLKYRILGKDVNIGRNFKVRVGFTIKGYGSVSIGNNIN